MEQVYYKKDCNECTKPCDCFYKKQNSSTSYPPLPPNQIDLAQYSQWHRRMEAIQHAIQAQVYRHLSGF